MKRSLVLIGSVAFFATAALAQNVDVIKSRQAIYKSMAAATKGPADMLKRCGTLRRQDRAGGARYLHRRLEEAPRSLSRR